MYYIAAQIIRHTTVTEKVAMACPKGLEVTLEGEHSLQVGSVLGDSHWELSTLMGRIGLGLDSYSNQ